MMVHHSFRSASSPQYRPYWLLGCASCNFRSSVGSHGSGNGCHEPSNTSCGLSSVETSQAHLRAEVSQAQLRAEAIYSSCSWARVESSQVAARAYAQTSTLEAEVQQLKAQFLFLTGESQGTGTTNVKRLPIQMHQGETMRLFMLPATSCYGHGSCESASPGNWTAIHPGVVDATPPPTCGSTPMVIPLRWSGCMSKILVKVICLG